MTNQMENKLLTKIKFDKPKKAEVLITDNKLVISGITFTTEHRQDCCENVYADFSSVKYYSEQILKMKEITEMEIKNVPDTGFIIFLYYGYEGKDRLGVLVNCYNEQNGYYSDDLELIITDGDKELGRFQIDKYDNID